MRTGRPLTRPSLDLLLLHKNNDTKIRPPMGHFGGKDPRPLVAVELGQLSEQASPLIYIS